MTIRYSSLSATSAVVVGGARACAEDADSPEVDVGTGRGGGGEVADGGVQERRTRHQLQCHLSSLLPSEFLALRLGQIARQRLWSLTSDETPAETRMV